MATSFGLTFDYRCPFARNGHEAAVNALRDGEDLDIRFLAFSLDQAHVEEGEPPVWERDPGEWGTGTLALLYGIAVRDAFPDYFLDAHIALFAQRHDHGLKLGHEDVLQEAVEKVGLDSKPLFDQEYPPAPSAAPGLGNCSHRTSTTIGAGMRRCEACGAVRGAGGVWRQP